MKLIIVDDNKLEREGVRDMFDWKSLGIEVVGCYADGKQGLEGALRHEPDIIISDMFMPVMDGIEMVKELRRRNIRSKVIYMTCYNDFEYAREAVNTDAEKLIMKPIFEDELENIILTVMNKTQEEIDISMERRQMMDTIQNSREILTEQFFRYLMYGKIKTREELEKKKRFLDFNNLDNMKFCIAYFHIAKPNCDDFEISFIIEKMIQERGSDDTVIQYIQENPNEFAIVFGIASDNIEIFVTDYVIQLKDEIFKKTSVNLKVGLSNIENDPLLLSRLYHQSAVSIKKNYFGGTDEIVFYRDIENIVMDSFDECVNTEQLYSEIKEMLINIDLTEIDAFIEKYLDNNMYSEMYVRNLITFTVASIQIVLAEMHISFGEIFGDNVIIWDKINNFSTILDIKQWIFNLMNSICQYIRNRNNNDKLKLVEDIKHFIKESYMDQFSVKEISGHFYVSAGYANKIFKEIEGMTIFDYLTRYRIEIAKKLLRVKSKKIYEVVNEVGYSNLSHFTYIFQKNTGMTPSEYKNSQ